MARLFAEPYQIDPARLAQYNLAARDPQSAELEFLKKQTEDLPEGAVKGAVMDFPVADGHAHYLVVEEAPLTVQHLNFWDGYSIPAAYVRGLEKEDVLESIHRTKAWARLAASSDQKKAKLGLTR